MKDQLTNFSISKPRAVIAAVVIAVIAFGIQFPKVHFDNDPENMLARDEPVRVFHNEVKKRYKLYDFVIVGIVNEKGPDYVFNVDTLGRIYKLTHELRNLHRDKDGNPAVRSIGSDGKQVVFTPKLTPESAWLRFLNVIFRHDPNDLFDAKGNGVIKAPEIISPSVVDNIKQAAFGSLKIEYLMEKAPTTREEALAIRNDAMNNPLYKGTLVSEDGKALCLYIPITAKHYAHNVANLVQTLTKDWPVEDQVYITGLPVAEDTFGVEMLVQMATSAPAAGLIIFILLLIFFRKIQLVIAPMIVAVVSCVTAMGLLIGIGYPVHIMSSMISIFLMPIAVTDSVHLLSEFYDSYQKFQDKAKTIKHVVHHLFMPMLYTSLTTIAGFASLMTTPIPPVRIFGAHVAFGVAIAWVMTVTFIPAYIMLFVSEKSLKNFGTTHTDNGRQSSLMRLLEKVGGFTYGGSKIILGACAFIVAISIFGITKIKVNDNPVKWFTPGHEIRIADKVLNEHFGGTYTAYLTLESLKPAEKTCREKLDLFREAVRKRFGNSMPKQTKVLMDKFDEMEQTFSNVVSCDPQKCFAKLLVTADKLDKETTGVWNQIADEINYLDDDKLEFDKLLAAVAGAKGVTAANVAELKAKLATAKGTKGEPLRETAMEICDKRTKQSFRDFLLKTHAEISAPPFKRPEVLRYVEKLQAYLTSQPKVGKTSSAVDALKKASYELNYVEGMDEKNETFRSVPPNASAVGQVYIQLEGMKKKDSLFHLVTNDYKGANIWVQLTSGDNKDMDDVVRKVDAYVKDNPPPAGLAPRWAGLTYLNVVWQDKMVYGMFRSLASSAVIVLIMMTVLFRSPVMGVLSMIPLTITILFIYGILGLVGKDYDMPVAVLSSLTLGLSVDFAIHFLERARETVAQYGSWKVASAKMFAEPAAAITRNGIVIAIGFLPLLLAPLVPYKTVGFFMAAIMAISGAGTLLILPALITQLEGLLFKKQKHQNEENAS